MPKKSLALLSLPPQVELAIRRLGEDLCIARKRRGESRRLWADRIGVSEPTVVRMENGDPAVAIGIYATALWLMGRVGELGELASPEFDLGALQESIEVAKKRSVRKSVSIQSRLEKMSKEGG